MSARRTPAQQPTPPEPIPADVPLGAVIESMADPVIVYDREWRVQYANPAAQQAFRSSGHGRMIGRIVWEEYPDLAGTAFERELRRAMEGRVPTSFVEERRARRRWAEGRCYPIPNGGLAVAWRDVTEQKRTQRALDYLLRASLVLGASLELDATCDALAHLIVPELADWCSISLLEGEAIRLVALAHADPGKVAVVRALDARYPSSPDARTRTARVIRTGETDLVTDLTPEMIDQAFDDAEYAATVKQLGFSAALTVPLPVRGRVVGAMSLVTVEGGHPRFDEADIALAEELGRRAAVAVENAMLYRGAVEARTAAETANSIKSDFLARMSHELRTPLNAIAGYVELIAMGVHGPLTEQQRSDLERIRRSEQYLLSLINDLLNHARLEAGRLHYDIRPVPVSAALESVEPLFAPRLLERRLTLRILSGDPAAAVLADAEKLRQILFNLVSNAVKFTPPEGVITLSSEAEDRYLVIVVADTGPGIPQDRLESVFDPFVQLRRDGEVHEGTGLGLAISRDLARGMGGDLTASCSGAGCTFQLRLPTAGTG